MNKYVAFLRAVNVGGTGKLPMAELRAMCEELGFRQVRTYIASGNVVLSSDKSKTAVKKILENRLKEYAGKDVGVEIRTGAELCAVYKKNPYSDQQPNFTLAIFLDKKPTNKSITDVAGLSNEQISIGTREIYVYFPDGIGRSKLRIAAAKQGTARNMNTIKKMIELIAQQD